MGTVPLYDGMLQYYYYIPCPTYSWFYAFGGHSNEWEHGTAVGTWFEVGDLSTGGIEPCDPTSCYTLEKVRVLDFEGAGYYPGWYRIKMDVYCCDEYGCPVGPPLYTREPLWTSYAWNYFEIDPPLCLTSCAADPGPSPSGPRFLVTITHDGIALFGHPFDNYNAWGADAVGRPFEEGCAMHDEGCLPALYPRPYSGHYSTIHSGYYGHDFEYCPPQRFKDPRDSTPDGSEYGFVELAWRVYLGCSGPTQTQETTWGGIKTLYR
jgi:hypothetical protein